MSDTDNLYRCANCNGIFEKTTSDEEALAEARELFGDLPQSQLSVVCDDCFKAFMEWVETNGQTGNSTA
jgi:hypothetical protein